MFFTIFRMYFMNKILKPLIDKGLGGMLFGPDNPTREATNFWDMVLTDFHSNERQWITAGLLAAGLPVM